MAKSYSYSYTVVGDGTFPHDMLRYDQCWPTHAEDGTEIANAGTRGRRLPNRPVQLTGVRMPTEDRWLSFGWKVEGAVRKNERV